MNSVDLLHQISNGLIDQVSSNGQLPVLISSFHKSKDLTTLQCATLIIVQSAKNVDLRRETVNGQHLPKLIQIILSNAYILNAVECINCVEALVCTFPTAFRPFMERLKGEINALSNKHHSNRLRAALCFCATKSDFEGKVLDLFIRSIAGIHCRLDRLLRAVDEEPIKLRKMPVEDLAMLPLDYKESFPLLVADIKSLIDQCSCIMQRDYDGRVLRLPVNDLMQLISRIINVTPHNSILRQGQDRKEFEEALKSVKLLQLEIFTLLTQVVRSCGRRMLRYRSLLVSIAKRLNVINRCWLFDYVICLCESIGGSCLPVVTFEWLFTVINDTLSAMPISSNCLKCLAALYAIDCSVGERICASIDRSLLLVAIGDDLDDSLQLMIINVLWQRALHQSGVIFDPSLLGMIISRLEQGTRTLNSNQRQECLRACKSLEALIRPKFPSAISQKRISLPVQETPVEKPLLVESKQLNNQPIPKAFKSTQTEVPSILYPVHKITQTNSVEFVTFHTAANDTMGSTTDKSNTASTLPVVDTTEMPETKRAKIEVLAVKETKEEANFDIDDEMLINIDCLPDND